MQNKKNVTLKIVFSFIFSIAIFISLIAIEKSLTEGEPQKEVIMTKKDIPIGTVLTKENLTQFFESQLVPQSIVPSNAMLEADKLENNIVLFFVNKNQILTTNYIQPVNEALKDIENPIEISLTVKDMSISVSGTIRSGDLVNIYSLDTTTKTSNEVLKNVYVKKAYDQEGKEITLENKDAAALTFTLLIAEKEVPIYMREVENATLRLAKVGDIGTVATESEPPTQTEPPTQPLNPVTE